MGNLTLNQIGEYVMLVENYKESKPYVHYKFTREEAKYLGII
jgi:hypothetical protein